MFILEDPDFCIIYFVWVLSTWSVFLTINLKRAHLDTLTQILHAPRILAFCYADRHFNFTYAIMSFPTKT